MGQSRNEDILQSIVDATQYTDPPKSRVEDLLLQVKEAIEEGGGGGGTSNYNDLSNQPQINGTTLTGNKSASDLGLVAAIEGKGLSTNDYTDADKAIVGGVTAALAGKQNVLTAGNNIKIDNNTISVNRWAVPAGKVVYTVITSDENYGQNVHIQRHTPSGGFIDDRTFLCEMYKTVNVDDLISIYNPYSSFRITLLEDSDEQQAGYNYTVNPITTPTSNSFTFLMEQEENANDLIIRSELDAEVNAIKDGQSIDSFADVETALATKADASDVKNEFLGTLDEWNALTTAQKKAYDTYQITDDYTEGSGGLPDYSTTEQLTGQKWIDGKDIYAITLWAQNQTFVNKKIEIDVSSLNIDKCFIDYNGSCFYDSENQNWNAFPWIIADTNIVYSVYVYTDIIRKVQREKIVVCSQNDFGSRITDIYVTIRYTKNA